MTQKNKRCQADDPPYVAVELIPHPIGQQQDPLTVEHLGDQSRRHPGVIELVKFTVECRRIVGDAIIGVILCSLPLLLQLVVPKSSEAGKVPVATNVFTSCVQEDKSSIDGVRFVTPMESGDPKLPAVPIVFQPCPPSNADAGAGLQVVLPVAAAAEAGKKPTGPVIFTPCSPTEGQDARVLILIGALIVGLAFVPRLRRLISESTIARPTISPTTKTHAANYVDAHRAVLGHRRFGVVVILAAFVVTWGISAIGTVSVEWIVTIINAGGWKLCESPQHLAALRSTWNSPIHPALFPWLAFLLVGVIAAVALGRYAGMRPAESKKVTEIREKYFTNWVHNSVSGALQRQLLLEQEHGHIKTDSLTQNRFQSVSHWLRLAYVFSAHCSRKPDVKRATTEVREEQLPERTFWRIVIAPIAAPLCATLVTPLALWAWGAEVTKPQYLAGIVVWVGWATYYLARIALGTTIKFQRLLVSQPSMFQLFLSLPVSREMRSSMKRYDAYHLGTYVNVILTVLFALMVGWVGAF